MSDSVRSGERWSATIGEAEEWSRNPSERGDDCRQGDRRWGCERDGCRGPAVDVDRGELRQETLSVVEAELPVLVAVHRLGAHEDESERHQGQQEEHGDAGRRTL